MSLSTLLSSLPIDSKARVWARKLSIPMRLNMFFKGIPNLLTAEIWTRTAISAVVALLMTRREKKGVLSQVTKQMVSKIQ